jgi:gamma-carbonic anhydrase
MNFISLGAGCSIGDGAVIYLVENGPTVVGEHCVVGQRAVLQGGTIEPRSLNGIQATMLDGAVIGYRSIVGAGAVIFARSLIPPL